MRCKEPRALAAARSPKRVLQLTSASFQDEFHQELKSRSIICIETELLGSVAVIPAANLKDIGRFPDHIFSTQRLSSVISFANSFVGPSLFFFLLFP